MSGFLRTDKRRNGKAWLTVLPAGKRVEVARGVNLLEAIAVAGESVAQRCGGRARCGECQVLVRQGWRGLSKVRQAERDRLAKVQGVDPLSRLACQAALGIHNNIVVELVNH
ncbi:2Fe-2S iron-sulfur cluster-binding protein [Candidatus Methylocalor cossyra]|uniref:Ferredoxin, 2Fe-2S n=1 Tax=Candidatus Methylocalor cossyra TaxID=3108543 RepID=A0ABP1C6C3_9GAMM